MMRPWEGVSASSIFTTAATGCHMLRINGYSGAMMVFSNGSPITSSEFDAAGHTWYIKYYLNGRSPEASDYISLYLRLADRDVGTIAVVNAKVRFSLVPHGGNPPPPPYGESLRAEFGRTMTSSGNGFPFFVRRDVLERSGYLLDDCFAVRCDIHVVRTSSSAPDATVEDHDLHRLGLACRICHDGGQCTVEEAAAPAPTPLRQRWFRFFGCGKFNNEYVCKPSSKF